MVELRICIDVDDIERAIDFYQRAAGLTLARRRGEGWAEMIGAAVPIDLLTKKSGSAASPTTTASRDYERHWTPVHLDIVVSDLDSAVSRALAAGATLDRDIQSAAWGRMANLADPFGHGLCLLEFHGRGYDEIAD